MKLRVPALLLLVAAGAWACGDRSTSGPPAGSSGRAAAERGLSPDWALLSLPATGGRASLHSLSDPGRELWNGTVDLPAVDRAVRMAPRLVVLRGPGGDVHRYDPAEGVVSRLGELAGDVRWYGGDDAGVWVRSSDGSATMWTLSPEGDHRRAVDRPVRWAAPAAEGGTVALLGPGGPGTLVRWPPGASEPDASLEIAAGPPAQATAWGRTAVLTRTDGEGVLQRVSLTEMEAGDRIELDGPVTAVAASPSSHEIYVAVDEPPRLVVVERITGEIRTRARFPKALEAIRPGVAGGPPVVWDGETARLVPWDGGELVELDTRWRSDLPLALPDGSVIVVRDGSVERTLAEGGARPSAGSADRVWVPVRWRAEAEGTLSGSAVADSVPGATPSGSAPGATAGDSAVGPESAADTARTDSATLDRGLRVTDAGFYVVLGWSGSPGEVREQLRPVREAGFPVAAQVRRDDAGDRWYRALVGPYGERDRAAEVARTLQREHAVQGWVHEVRPGLLTDEVLR